MDPIDELLEWATSEGVILNGIAAKAIPGRGIGIVATRALKADEELLTVPTSILRSIGNTPKAITRKLKGATVQAILSASLCLDADPGLAKWKAIFPSNDDLRISMPICWPPKLQALLPPSAALLLAKQQSMFTKDWDIVHAAYPNLDREQYLLAWLLVNNRTFYHTTPRTQKLPKNDRMVLQPVADLFNHSASDDCCRVAYDAESYSVTTTRAHKPGEELFIRYGAHHNDFLLVEYGFALPAGLNAWDETSLDEYLCPRFSAHKRGLLENAGFWGEYVLDAETACYRTQTALRMLCLGEEQWQAVLDGQRDEDEGQERVDSELGKVLRAYEKDVRGMLVRLDRLKVGKAESREILRQRWLQIKELVVSNMSRLQS